MGAFMESCEQGPGRVRGTGRRAGPDRPGAHPQDPAAGGRPGRDRRPLRRDRRRSWPATRIVDCDSFDRATEIAARLSNCPGPGPRPRASLTWTSGRSPSPGPTWSPDRGPCRGRAPRTCCASWRRRSSARWCGGTGTSTPPRTRCRRRCWRPPPSGRADGLPDNPRGWLITVASRRLTDLLRSEQSRRAREERGRPADPAGGVAGPGGRRRGRRAGRHAHPAVPVLPPRAVARLADRADPARGRRPDHRGDRPGLPGSRGDHDPADHPGQGSSIADSGVPFGMPTGPERAQRLAWSCTCCT